MRGIDACYERGAFGLVLDLEQQLEKRLWALEHYLEELDEDEELPSACAAMTRTFPELSERALRSDALAALTPLSSRMRIPIAAQ